MKRKSTLCSEYFSSRAWPSRKRNAQTRPRGQSGYFTGHWMSEADVKPGPMGPGGKYHADDHTEWMDEASSSSSTRNSTAPAFPPAAARLTWAHDAQEKVYTYDAFDSMGEATHSKGSVEGDTWTWLNDMKEGPQTMKGRFTMKILSPTEYSYKYEASSDGTKWTVLMEGKETKQK